MNFHREINWQHGLDWFLKSINRQIILQNVILQNADQNKRGGSWYRQLMQQQEGKEVGLEIFMRVKRDEWERERQQWLWQER